MLLQSLELLQLDRKLLLLLASSLMPACIIPIGPDWQDPEGAPNSRPYMLSASPPEAARTTMPDPTFSVVVGDANVREPLFVRWIFEFPNDVEPFFFDDPNLDPDPNGSEIREPATRKVMCGQIDSGLSLHQIMVAISDRPWLDLPFPKGNEIISAQNGTSPVIVSWTWEMSCQP